MATFKVKFQGIIITELGAYRYSPSVPGKHRKQKPMLEEHKEEIECNSSDDILALLEKRYTNVKGLKIRRQ